MQTETITKTPLRQRLIARSDLAEYLGITPSTLDKWVAKGVVPKPVPGTARWDLRAIDARLDHLSQLDEGREGVADATTETPLDRWLRENGSA